MQADREDGMTDVGDGQKIPTMRLVEKLRRFRGRLTKRLLCQALGYSSQNRTAYVAVCRLCREYEIITADEHDGGWFPGKTVDKAKPTVATATKRRIDDADDPAVKLRLAREALKVEIQMAIAEQATARPYKANRLEW